MLVPGDAQQSGPGVLVLLPHPPPFRGSICVKPPQGLIHCFEVRGETSFEQLDAKQLEEEKEGNERKEADKEGGSAELSDGAQPGEGQQDDAAEDAAQGRPNGAIIYKVHVSPLHSGTLRFSWLLCG